MSGRRPAPRAAGRLDATLAAWRNRPLGEIAYLYLDARYETVREDGQLRDLAVLIAVGVDREGQHRVLGVSTSLTVQEPRYDPHLDRNPSRGDHRQPVQAHRPGLDVDRGRDA